MPFDAPPASALSFTSPWFSTASPWNTPIARAPTVIVNYQMGPLGAYMGGNRTVTLNLDFWTPALIDAPVGTPTQTMTWPGWVIYNFPLPSAIYPALTYFASKGDTDSAVCIYSESTGLFYQSLGTRSSIVNGSNVVTVAAAAIINPNGYGWWDNALNPWGGRASGGAFCAGVIRPAELQSGVINHALAAGWPHTLIGSNMVVFPATTSDGTDTNAATAMPSGALLQLNPALSDAQMTAMGLKSGDLVIAHAMQKYGVYTVDSSESMAVYFQAGLGQGLSIYPNITTSWPAGMMQYFRVVATPTPTGFFYDSRLNEPVIQQ